MRGCMGRGAAEHDWASSWSYLNSLNVAELGHLNIFVEVTLIRAYLTSIVLSRYLGSYVSRTI